MYVGTRRANPTVNTFGSKAFAIQPNSASGAPHRLSPGELLEMAFDPAALEVGEELGYLREGYPPKLLRQLKRGQFSVQDELDLHQMNAAAAQASIATFLAEARQHGRRCVRIIHGKGLRSKAAGPVLKVLTDRLLRRRDDVVAFASARPAQGGTGAVVVLLRD